MDIQPFFKPPLDGIGKFHIEIIYVGADAHANTAYIVGDVPRVVAPEVKNAFP